ncbi:transglutaminase family protein [Cumulibacter manganitolerans]|uniref:transglutaminase family protein n=1 Tax=Cumulibacter manganitolerans TaxID=1884992 RepID=UPI001295316D|nr:DUF3488 and transglutaminase-like domain-containing protein [Cumulibacter manganitolerans]
MSAGASPVTAYAAPVVAGAATITTLATIGPVFSDQRWLVTSAVVVAVVVGSGIALRAFRVPQAYVSVIQLVLGIYGLLLLTCGSTMLAGFIPTPESFGQLLALIGEGARTARTKVAPISPTPGTAALLALLVIPVAVLVDDCAVTRRPALAGIPLLTLFAICAAIVRHPIAMALVAVPVLCFLVLLWLAELERGPRRGLAAGLGSLASGAVIAAVAIALAAATTVVVRLPDGGIFSVSGNTDRSPNESVARSTDLIGQLSRKEALPLFKVQTDDPSPYYLRALTLETWGKRGWSFTNTKDSGVDLADIPQGSGPKATSTTHTTVEVQKYSDVFVPTYYSPTQISLRGGRFDRDMAVAFTDSKGEVENTTYAFTSQVPRPTSEELAAVQQTADSVPPQVKRDLAVPADVDPAVVALTEQVTAEAGTPWQVAVALDSFFSDTAQGWTYSLDVPDPKGADPLASFLQKRRGFCEQYASAMAAMFRIAGVPARVAVGYTKGTKQADQSYVVTTDDAHAWVEAYFGDVGWIAFDPTPIGDRAVPLSYVPSDQIDPSALPSADPAQGAEQTQQTDELPSTTAAPRQAQPAGGPASSSPWADVLRWLLIGLLAAAVLVGPALLRGRRWRSRLAWAGRLS